MQPRKGTSRNYEVERRSHYAARPGFRIAELQISPTQMIPWHYHSDVQDTFYVINGTIRIFTREPQEEVCLTVGQTYAVRPGRPTTSISGPLNPSKAAAEIAPRHVSEVPHPDSCTAKRRRKWSTF